MQVLSISAYRNVGERPGTVGPIAKETIIKIGEGGEVLIKGPQAIKGYYENEVATKESITEGGFFRTGDIGEIDKEGYLKITGRIRWRCFGDCSRIGIIGIKGTIPDVTERLCVS